MQSPDSSSAHLPTPVWRTFWAIGAAITLARILVLIFSPTNLGPDEAQYWYWSRDLAFGYFSKPPLIAWAIAMTTGLFGNSEWAVRLSAPLFHFGTAGFLYLTATALFDRRVAFWTGLGWLTLPGVILSSFLIATDAPLLFFWSAALYCLARIIKRDKTSIADFSALGAMIGFGLLSKYAMIYFPAAMAAMLFYKPFRQQLLRPQLALTALIALALFAPNIIWNSQHDFQTISHTAANAKWGASLFKPLSLLSFITGQFVVLGIIPFAALIYFAAQPKKYLTAHKDHAPLMLSIFAATPLLIVAVQAFLSRAHANWAAAAYPAALLLVTALLFREGRGIFAKASIAVHGVMLLAFFIGVLSFGLLDQIKLSGATKDLRGWKEQTAAIMTYADGYDAVLVDDRYLISVMLYYQRDAHVPIVAIDPNRSIDNHFEAFRPFDPKLHKRVLFVTTREDSTHVDHRFHTIKFIATVEQQLGGKHMRRYGLYELEDYFGRGAN